MVRMFLEKTRGPRPIGRPVAKYQMPFSISATPAAHQPRFRLKLAIASGPKDVISSSAVTQDTGRDAARSVEGAARSDEDRAWVFSFLLERSVGAEGGWKHTHHVPPETYERVSF